MKGKSLVSISDFSKDELLKLLDLAAIFEHNPNQKIISDKIVAILFFEPSTRTRLSFEAATKRLGGQVIGFSDTSTSSVTKGETLYDTIKTVNNYSDLIVMRHPLDGSARYASEIATVPVVNAGDGSNQHPTQTLLDLYSIRKTQQTLDNLKICFVGDMKYGRTVHSLLMALSHFNPIFYFVSPQLLAIPKEYKMFLNSKKIKFSEHREMNEVLNETDILYMTRVQRERFSDPIEYEKTKNIYVLKADMLKDTKENLKILHPLPRVNEISTDVDSTDKAYYFQQVGNGMYVRQAIIASLLGAI